MNPILPIRVVMRMKRCQWIMLLAAASCTGLYAQQSLPAPATTVSTDTNGMVARSGGPTANSASLGTRSSLTAGQIGAILQQKPEVVIEIKSLIAEQLQQQGRDTQADSISDEMLYRQISSSSDLRSSITLWLRARGYISNADLQRSLSEAADDGTLTHPFDTLTQVPGSDLLQEEPSFEKNPSGTLLNDNAFLRPESTKRSEIQSQKETDRRERNITDSPEVLRLPTPYNLLSLRDLYTQIPADDVQLKRFGSEVFLNRDATSAERNGLAPRSMSMDVPVGPDYVLGTGDGLVINLSGGISQSLNKVVDREGQIVLPEAGPLVVAGLTLQQAQSAIEDTLKRQFHNAHVDVSVARLRSVRVYVVGDVQRPGAYELNSLSTPLNALYAAGGPTGIGSLRLVRHYRGKQLIREVDLYDFLLHGARMEDERLQAGDTLLVPPAGPQVAVTGMVKRPAIYELKGHSTLNEVLEDAGGATAAAALDHITIDRIQPDRRRETISFNLPLPRTPEATSSALVSFSVKDGDRIRVAAILPYSESAIYIQGHVARPGKYAYREGMQLSDVIRSYQDLLPEPAAAGDIVRLVSPDLHPETIQFNLADVLIGNSNIALQPFDTIRIFGRYEADSPQVTVRGEVLRPGTYALSQGMTAAQLVRMAGGFKRDALLENADLASYTVQNGKEVIRQRTTIAIGTAVKGEVSATDVSLKPGDVLTIHQLSGWNDIGASISLQGEVAYPGSYGLQDGERLSSVLRRAGGFRDTAYPTGAILARTQVRELEEKSRDQLIRQIETTSASARLAPNLTGQDQMAVVQAAAQQQKEILEKLRSQPASGRMVIHIDADISRWANTPADIELRSGDVLTVPKRPGFVLVTGQVYNASAITFIPGKNAGWYLRRAGGTNDVANRKEIFVIRANGSVVGKRSGEWFDRDVLSTRLDPGDVVVVPQKVIGGSMFWRNLLTVAQLSSSIAFTAAVAGVF
jgi:protein involved in polysaccharide export with SLBB domain